MWSIAPASDGPHVFPVAAPYVVACRDDGYYYPLDPAHGTRPLTRDLVAETADMALAMFPALAERAAGGKGQNA